MTDRDTEYFHRHINDTLNALGLNEVGAHDIVDIIDEHRGHGVGTSANEVQGDNFFSENTIQNMVHLYKSTRDKRKTPTFQL